MGDRIDEALERGDLDAAAQLMAEHRALNRPATEDEERVLEFGALRPSLPRPRKRRTAWSLVAIPLAAAAAAAALFLVDGRDPSRLKAPASTESACGRVGLRLAEWSDGRAQRLASLTIPAGTKLVAQVDPSQACWVAVYLVSPTNGRVETIHEPRRLAAGTHDLYDEDGEGVFSVDGVGEWRVMAVATFEADEVTVENLVEWVATGRSWDSLRLEVD